MIIFILKIFKVKRTLNFFNALLWPIRWLLVLIIGRNLFKIVAYSVGAKSIEDILGAMTLLGARPVEIGDFVKFGDKVGTIEDISLRLTKVRTLD